MSYHAACRRYKIHRKHTRELLEEELLHSFGERVHVLSIDEDILRRARQEWYEVESRPVQWDWDAGVIRPFHNHGPRGLDIALSAKSSLCGMAVARLSSTKKWLSLTHIEGSPTEHPLKGQVLPIVVRALYIYRTLICGEQSCESTGIRVMNPLDDAVPYYCRSGYTSHHKSKWLNCIVVEEPRGAKDEDANEDRIDAQAENGA